MPNSELLDAVRAYVAAIAPGHAPTWISIELDNDRNRVVQLPVIPAVGGKVSGSCPEEEEEPAEELTDCERDVIELLEVAGKRLTGDEIKDQLQTANRLHGDSTVTKALSRLVNQKRRLSNRRDSYGKGYGLADWS